MNEQVSDTVSGEPVVHDFYFTRHAFLTMVIQEFGVRKSFVKEVKWYYLYFPPLDVYSLHDRFYFVLLLCSFKLNIDAGKYFKNNTHSYLYVYMYIYSF